MGYWWVSQNQTYKVEFEGGFLWAPKASKSGRIPHHWANMTKVKEGDTIFSYVKKKIVRIATAQGEAYSSQKPSGFEDWSEINGWKIDVEYKKISSPPFVSSLWEQLKNLLPEKYSPLTANGTGNQGYLFGLPEQAGIFLLKTLEQNNVVQSPLPVIPEISEPYVPVFSDVENAYKTLGSSGELIMIDVLLDQIEADLKHKNTLKSNWRKITERNIELWAEQGRM